MLKFDIFLMNNILSSFRKKKKKESLDFILILIPVLSSFSRAKCLVQASIAGTSEYD